MLKNLQARAADFIFAAPLTAAFTVMFVFFAVRGEGFFNADNLGNVALQSAAHEASVKYPATGALPRAPAATATRTATRC